MDLAGNDTTDWRNSCYFTNATCLSAKTSTRLENAKGRISACGGSCMDPRTHSDTSVRVSPANREKVKVRRLKRICGSRRFRAAAQSEYRNGCSLNRRARAQNRSVDKDISFASRQKREAIPRYVSEKPRQRFPSLASDRFVPPKRKLRRFPQIRSRSHCRN